MPTPARVCDVAFDKAAHDLARRSPLCARSLDEFCIGLSRYSRADAWRVACSRTTQSRSPAARSPRRKVEPVFRSASQLLDLRLTQAAVALRFHDRVFRGGIWGVQRERAVLNDVDRPRSAGPVFGR